MGFAFSSTVKGVAAYSSPAYYCANGDEKNAEDLCLKPKNFDLKKIQTGISYLETNGYIDPTSNLNSTKVYLFGGRADLEVPYTAV